METAVALSSYLPTGIKMRGRFSSRLITLDDAHAFLGLLRNVIEAVAAEVEGETGEEVLVLPTVKISEGSIAIEIDIKVSNWSATVKARMSEAFLAAVLALSPANADSTPDYDEISYGCREVIETAVETTMETWKFHGKGYTAEFEVSCGNAKVESRIQSPANPPR